MQLQDCRNNCVDWVDLCVYAKNGWKLQTVVIYLRQHFMIFSNTTNDYGWYDISKNTAYHKIYYEILLNNVQCFTLLLWQHDHRHLLQRRTNSTTFRWHGQEIHLGILLNCLKILKKWKHYRINWHAIAQNWSNAQKDFMHSYVLERNEMLIRQMTLER